MGTPYKMKGNPMQRNFGIGSPAKDTDPHKTTPDHPAHEKEEFVKGKEKTVIYGGSESKYTPEIDKKTQRLINLGAPKDVIEKSKAESIKRFKEQNLGKDIYTSA